MDFSSLFDMDSLLHPLILWPYGNAEKGVERNSILSNLSEEQVADRLAQLTASSK